VAVLAGGRMAERTRRVGLLKAVGGTPGLVAVILLAENLVLALAAAAAGLVIGWLGAPLITNPGAGLVGTPGAPSLTLSTAGLVVAVALVVALAATAMPAIRAAHTSTVRALANTTRRPRRRAGLIRISRRLPVPLLLGLRLVARRPRRALLGTFSIAVTTMGVVAILTFHATADRRLSGPAGGLGNPVYDRDEQMLMVLTVVLLTLSALNAIVATWATVLDARPAAALARALGATPQQVSAGMSAAQVLPALPGAILGVPLGIGLFAAANDGDDPAPGLVAGRRGAGNPGRGGRADRDSGPHWRPPSRGRDPAGRDGLTQAEAGGRAMSVVRRAGGQSWSGAVTPRRPRPLARTILAASASHSRARPRSSGGWPSRGSTRHAS
jgi:hypothetical protein